MLYASSPGTYIQLHGSACLLQPVRGSLSDPEREREREMKLSTVLSSHDPDPVFVPEELSWSGMGPSELSPDVSVRDHTGAPPHTTPG